MPGTYHKSGPAGDKGVILIMYLRLDLVAIDRSNV